MPSEPLVVLRSWNDGDPPVVRRIAKDSDHKESQLIVIPDHNGTFITQEVPLGKELPDELAKVAPNNNRMKFVNRRSKFETEFQSQSATSEQLPNGNGFDGHTHTHTNGGNGYHTQAVNGQPNSLHRSLSTMSPIPFRAYQQHLHETNLMRSRSTLSIDSGGTPTSPNTSIPSSPNPNSRYKSLGPEFEATVPKRLIINRTSWIRHDTSNRLSRVSDDDDCW